MTVFLFPYLKNNNFIFFSCTYNKLINFFLKMPNFLFITQLISNCATLDSVVPPKLKKLHYKDLNIE